MITTNFHTHTNLCDGADTPEEMVISAIEKGFTALGFSGHSYFSYEPEITMTKEKLEIYRSEIARLKDKYRDKIEIFCGIEQDYFSPEPDEDFDYIIGSVHCLFKNDIYVPVDLSAESSLKAINELYNGSFDDLASAYFQLVGDVVNKTNCDIIGHFDLVSKYNEINGFEQSERYLACAENAVKKLTPYGKPFEINTGAMSRKIKSIPYPSLEILQMIKANGGKIIFSSDCHSKENLDFAFEEALNSALKAGFSEHAVITGNGIKLIPLK